VTEAELQQNVIDLCRWLKLRVAHFRPAMTKAGNWITPVAADGAGFPDLVIVGRGGVIFAELKSAKGRLSHEQQEWIGDLHMASQRVVVWRPEHWMSGEIERELRSEG